MPVFTLFDTLLCYYHRLADSRGKALLLILGAVGYHFIFWGNYAFAQSPKQGNEQQISSAQKQSFSRQFRQDNDIIFRRLNTDQGLSQSNVYTVLQDRQGFVWIGTADGLNRYDGTSFKIFKRVPGDRTSLSDNFVTALFEDQSGTLWVGTRDGGLNKFNRTNTSFTRYQHSTTQKNSLSANYVRKIAQDSKGFLWIATDNGLNKFDPQSGTFHIFQREAKNVGSLRANSTKSLTFDKQGFVWVSTEEGIDILNPETGKCTEYRAENRAENQSGKAALGKKKSASTQDKAATKDRAAIKSLTNQVIRGMKTSDTDPILTDTNGDIWVGTSMSGLYRIDAASRSVVEHFTSKGRNKALPGELLTNDITALFLDSKGNLWAGTGGGGLYLFNRKTRTFSRYTYDPANSRSLSGDIIMALAEDRSGAYWVATYGNGINVFHSQANVFQTTVCFPQSPNDLLPNSVYALLEDREGMIWIGTEVGLLRFNPVSRKIESIKSQVSRSKQISGFEASFPSAVTSAFPSSTPIIPFVRNIIEGSDGTIWLATDSGLEKLDRKTLRRTLFQGTISLGENSSGNALMNAAQIQDSSVKQAFKLIDPRITDQTFTICESRTGLLWIGTRGAGVKVFDPRSERFVGHFIALPNQPSLAHNFVRCIREDGAGRIWIGTRGGGLCCYNPHTNEWKTFRHDDNNPNSLSHDAIFSLHFSSDSVLWIGTQGGGICRMDVPREQFIAWKEDHGLANNVVYAVLEDAQGDLWMSTHQGLARMSPPSGEKLRRMPLATDAAKAYTPFRNYDANDGLQNNEFNAGAYCKTADGRLIFGGLQGFSEFYPDSVRVNSYIPPIAITALRRFGEEVRLEPDISLLDTLHLSYKDNVFSLEFAALSFVQSEESRFKYVLEGFDAKWISAGTRHEARYTNLPGGKYTFRVKACNNDGIWNESGKALLIIVEPPFWETWWFRILGLTVIVVAGVISYRGRMKIIERRAAALEREVEIRTLELRESNDRLQGANEEIQRQISLLDEQTREIEVANATLQEKNLELEHERRTSERLILNVLPESIARRLRAGEERIADGFDSVSVLFADIVGFTELAARQAPEEVVEILNTVFSAFDIFSERYNLEKIKTIGDAYMIVGGVPEPMPNHAEAIADMALEMLQTLEILRYTMKIPLEVRIGIHTGPVVAGVIGQKKFAYDLWGDTVNTASRMESHGETGKIHCSLETYTILREKYTFDEPRILDVKGKGQMQTYFLTGRKS